MCFCLPYNSLLWVEPYSYYSIGVKVLWIIQQNETLDIQYLKIIHLTSFKLTASIADTHRCLPVNFLSTWINFKVTKILLN